MRRCWNPLREPRGISPPTLLLRSPGSRAWIWPCAAWRFPSLRTGPTRATSPSAPPPRSSAPWRDPAGTAARRVPTSSSSTPSSVSADKLNWRPFTMALTGGHKVRDLAALRDCERPAGLGLSKEELDRHWNPLTSEVKDASTMSTAPPKPTGPAPTILNREEVIKRAGARLDLRGAASASPSPR